MTINLADNTPRVSYAVAEGVTQTSFTVSFEFFDDADLNVYVDGTLKTLTTDYTVSGGNGSTGTVSISVTGASGGSTVVITRDIALERTTDFPASGAFQIGSLNTELDRLTAIASDLDDKASRSLQLTDYDTAVSLVLPDVDTRKGKTLAFNATTGAVESGPSISDVQTVSAAAADIATLADIEDGTDATDAIQTVAGISSNVTTVAGISANVTTVAGISSAVSTVAADTTDIGTVATNISSVNTVATNIADVITVANDLNEAISEVETVANDLNEAVSEIDTVAGSISNVDTVGTNISNVNTVAGISANVTTVAGVSANVTTVAGISGNVTTVAGISADVSTVAADGTDIGTVAGSISNVNTVAAADSNITTIVGQITPTNNIATVAGDSANIGTVAGISSNVTTVAGISSNVTTVAGVSADVTTVAGQISPTNNVGTVAGISSDVTTAAGISANITTVAGISSNVTTVAGISGNVTTVAGISSDVTAVAADATDIGTVATDITNVNTVATNISGVNSFAERYRVASADPTTSLDAGDLAFNTTDSLLKYYNGSAWESISPGLTDIVGDTTPQLGGNLDTNGNDINFGDDDKAIFGSALDGLQIYNTAAGDKFISEAGSGNLKIQGDNLYLQNSAGTENHIIAISDGAVTLHYDNAAKLATTTSGINVTGEVQADSIVMNDSETIYLGNSADLRIYHDGSNSYIEDLGTGDLRIKGVDVVIQQSDGNNQVASQSGGAVSLSHNGVTKLATSSTGVTVTGTVTATAFAGDGSALTGIAGFPSGTLMLFQQTAAPTGWTKQTTHNDKALRVVSGTAGSGGSSAFSTALGTPTVSGSVSISGNIGNTTLSTSQIPSHSHGYQRNTDNSSGAQQGGTPQRAYTTANTNNTGGGGAHNHGHNMSGSLSSATAGINVQYVDLIIASKD